MRELLAGVLLPGADELKLNWTVDQRDIASPVSALALDVIHFAPRSSETQLTADEATEAASSRSRMLGLSRVGHGLT